ncbi:MAG: acetyl/propionyl/methylcrotonyl-CoA carboxylase subunit alpha [Terricaulis sp.]
MLKSVLIANRGEIARRVIRTAKRLGVRTVAVYSDADAKALHVREADEAVHIGASPAKESYLRGEKIIAAAKQTGAEAIHPGYGFLSENADFAQAVIDAGLIWIGPKPDSIRAMGLKDAAKKLMAEAGVPTTPGYLGEDQSEERLQKEADAIGYPVLIKAVAGGGGKGMRKVERQAEFKAALASAKREAAAAFGDDRVLLEMYVQRPRHIEVQVFGDTHGNVVHLFERDCSLQRRHQKVIEEAPAPGMDEATRKAVTDAAVLAARAVNYVGAGTIEFIADASEGLRGDRIWFMEMNTRLQVEHPVTEEITGQDLVEWQLRVASGEKLPLKQDELAIDGHAIEARLYAENPETGFLPSIGALKHARFARNASDVRVDAAVQQGDDISPNYDPMIAKLIVWRSNRVDAIADLRTACATTEVWPVKTNAEFLARLLGEPAFSSGDVDTGLIERDLEKFTKPSIPGEDAKTRAAQAIISAHHTEISPWVDMPGFRLNAAPRVVIRLRARDQSYVVELDPKDADGSLPFADERLYQDYLFQSDGVVVFERGAAHHFTLDTGERSADDSAAGDGAILSPMPGKIVSVAAKAGATLKKGDPILVLEAMKMEHTLTAPFDGKLTELSAKAGAQVSEGTVLARVEEEKA